MKQIGLAAALLGLGIALGAGWRRLVRPRFKTDATMPTVQPTPAHPIPPPFQVATEQKSTELAPIQTTDTEQMPQQNGSTEPPSESAPAAEHDPLQSSLDTAQPSPADKEDEQLAHPRLKAEAATPLIQAASPPAAQTSIHEPSALDPLQQRLAATQKWLNNEDDTHFTIQLILLADTGAEPQLESVLSRLDREIGLTQIFVYPTRNAAGHQFGIAFGNFSSREQALAALATLPTDYRKSRLALRTVMGIRGEIAEQQII
jgi:septal ring-binding cell division protein DamX